jgi:hypothetical protein
MHDVPRFTLTITEAPRAERRPVAPPQLGVVRGDQPRNPRQSGVTLEPVPSFGVYEGTRQIDGQLVHVLTLLNDTTGKGVAQVLLYGDSDGARRRFSLMAALWLDDVRAALNGGYWS